MPQNPRVPEITDPITNTTAPVTVRVISGHGRAPRFILIGDAPARPGDPLLSAKCDNDAGKIYAEFRQSLPGDTFHLLASYYLRGWLKGRMSGSPPDADVQDAMRIVIRFIERRFGDPDGCQAEWRDGLV